MYQTFHKLKISHQVSKRFLSVRFLPFKWFYWLFSKFQYSKRITINGKKITILLRGGVGTMNFVDQYEPWFDQLLQKIKPPDKSVFLDVGANVGQTILKVLPYFPNLEYHAFEPNPDCAKYLEELCYKNAFTGVQIHRVALSDRSGETELLTRFKDDILGTTSSGFRQFTNYAIKQKVTTITGDELVRNRKILNVSIIKVDVEGGEVNVLRGFEKTIQRDRPLIICEILPLQSKSEEVAHYRTRSASKILAMMKDADYTVFNIITKAAILRIEDLSKTLNASNYLLIPNERKSVEKFL